jgi:hypothetical protein
MEARPLFPSIPGWHARAIFGLANFALELSCMHVSCHPQVGCPQPGWSVADDLSEL